MFSDHLTLVNQGMATVLIAPFVGSARHCLVDSKNTAMNTPLLACSK